MYLSRLQERRDPIPTALLPALPIYLPVSRELPQRGSVSSLATAGRPSNGTTPPHR